VFDNETAILSGAVFLSYREVIISYSCTFQSYPTNYNLLMSKENCDEDEARVSHLIGVLIGDHDIDRRKPRLCRYTRSRGHPGG
jgi:hypothetical protein